MRQLSDDITLSAMTLRTGVAIKRRESDDGDDPYQPDLGTHCISYRCSLPGLAGFTNSCCEGTGKGHHK